VPDERDERDSENPPSSDSTDVSAWSREEQPKKRKKPRNRITLSVVGPPLALPITSSRAPVPPLPEDTHSTELALPGESAPTRSPSSPGFLFSEDPEAIDAWSRTREVPASVTPRMRTETPPPFPPAERRTEDNDAIALVSQRSRPPGSSALDPSGEMLDRFALGDFSGALLAAEIALGKNPDDAEAQRCAVSCRERLCDMHLSRLGGAARVPKVAIAGSEVRWLGLDHRAGFLLSRVDGRSSIDDIVDLSGMARHEALKLLVELVDAGALRV
jgi:hypothetical protein